VVSATDPHRRILGFLDRANRTHIFIYNYYFQIISGNNFYEKYKFHVLQGNCLQYEIFTEQRSTGTYNYVASHSIM
jgi:hypothetical protein